MELTTILNILADRRNGVAVKCHLLTEVKTLKKAKDENVIVTKETFTYIRKGIEYDNMASVKEKRENGTLPTENAGLPWGEWIEGLEGIAITHKGNEYVRLYPQSLIVPTVKYFANGVETSKDELVANGYVSKSTFAPKLDKNGNPTTTDCYTIKTTSIVSIGQKIETLPNNGSVFYCP